MKRVNIIGLGYIGLPTALMFAANGVQVVGTDINSNVVKALNAGKVTFQETGLKEVFDEAIRNGIRFTTEYEKSSNYIIAVPTPYDSKSKKIDPLYLIEAFKSVLDVCDEEATIIIESTISPGTIDKYIRPLIKRHATYNSKISIAHAPERIIPGRMIYELENNHRIIGVDNKNIGEEVKALYLTFCKGQIAITDIRTAEMTKVIENTYRDINIAFANEILKICHYGNLDAYEIIRLANMHPRVNILKPGPGVGGHCISVDPWFLVGDYPGLANIILAARKINDSMPSFVIERVNEIMALEGITDINRVGIYGLTYKEDVEDIRESPTLQLIRIMKDHLAKPLKVYDPYIKSPVVDNQYNNFSDFIAGIDLLIIMVGHKHLLEQMDLLEDKILLDTKKCIQTNKTYYL